MVGKAQKQKAILSKYSLPKNVYDEVEDRMFKVGFRQIQKPEVLLCFVLGIKNYQQILSTSFEFSYQEALYLNEPTDTQEFKDRCSTNRRQILENLVLKLPWLIGQEIHFERPTDEELRQQVRKKYKSDVVKIEIDWI